MLEIQAVLSTACVTNIIMYYYRVGCPKNDRKCPS